jgi:hypothetical protein
VSGNVRVVRGKHYARPLERDASPRKTLDPSGEVDQSGAISSPIAQTARRGPLMKRVMIGSPSYIRGEDGRIRILGRGSSCRAYTETSQVTSVDGEKLEEASVR